MATDLTGNPLVIDTTTANAFTAMASGIFAVQSVRWVSKSAAGGHQAQITDPQTGRILFESVASGANFVDRDHSHVTWQNGFAVPKLDSGVIYVAIDRVLVLKS